MKALLDEGVPKQIAHLLSERGLSVSPFPKAWKGLANGRLLAEAHAAGYTVLIASDKNLRHQQSRRTNLLSVLVLPTQNAATLLAIIDEIAFALSTFNSTSVVVLDRDGRPIVGAGQE